MNAFNYFRYYLDRGRCANRETCRPSPPPTYRSHNGTLMRTSVISSNSQENLRSEANPPQYRTIDRHTQTQLEIQQQQSGAISSTVQSNSSVSPSNNPNNVHINISNITTMEVHEQPASIDTISPPIKDSVDKVVNEKSIDSTSVSRSSNTELVTIVTVSGCTDIEQSSNEMEILAHL